MIIKISTVFYATREGIAYLARTANQKAKGKDNSFGAFRLLKI